MATVTEKVKESLVGTEVEPQLSSQTRYLFTAHAVKDEEKDEYFMGEDQFIDAIAPEGEDYVRMRCLLFCCLSRRTASRAEWAQQQQQQQQKQHSEQSKHAGLEVATSTPSIATVPERPVYASERPPGGTCARSGKGR